KCATPKSGKPVRRSPTTALRPNQTNRQAHSLRRPFTKENTSMSQFLTTQSSATAPCRTRRNFLRQSARATLGLGLLCVADSLAFGQIKRKLPTTKDGYFAVPDEARDSLAALKRSSFARYNGDPFEATNDYGQPVILNLFKIEDLRAQRDLKAQRKLTESEEQQ